MRLVRVIVLLLVIAGSINWGLWEFFQYDLVQDYLGSIDPKWARVAYGCIAFAGIFAISFLFSKGTCGFCCKHDEECKKM
jgi:uncharacterized protein